MRACFYRTQKEGTDGQESGTQSVRPKFFDQMIVDTGTAERALLWTQELGVTLPALEIALHRAGPLLNDVREELGMARLYIFPRDDKVMERLIANGMVQRD